MHTGRFLILGLDGLRADMVCPDLTPNVLRLAQQGVFFRRHHAVFPTATRVNVASLVTGAHSGTHGIVNNSMFVPDVSPDKPVDLGNYAVVEAADTHYHGALLSTPSLGEILATHGETMIAVSSGTTGSNRLMHHKVKSLGGIGFSAQGVDPCHPRSEAEIIMRKFGPPPAAGTPDAARLAHITDVFLDYLFPTYQPRVTILWFSDPDKTHHHFGIGSPEGLEAVRAADTQLGRIMDWLQHLPQPLNLIVLSDHGHITVRQQVAVRDALCSMGIPAGNGYYEDGGVGMVPWSTGAVHIHNHDPHLIRRIATWMQEQPWCGCLFTPGKNEIEGIVPGTFARSLALNEHPRTGDIVYVLRTDEEPDAHGIVGGTYDDSRLSLGGGTHGGLSQHELRNVCVASGPAFQSGKETWLPSGTIDLMPTLLHLMGVDIPSSVDGRILHEALLPPSPEADSIDTTTYDAEASTPAGLYQQRLTVSRVGSTTYLDRGWTE
ncbi:hypothetical protein NKDENANG_01235 [Candidatus Entotheonellaceae bacterium PAL068K]